jgi:hypothetical protein
MGLHRSHEAVNLGTALSGAWGQLESMMKWRYTHQRNCSFRGRHAAGHAQDEVGTYVRSPLLGMEAVFLLRLADKSLTKVYRHMFAMDGNVRWMLVLPIAEHMKAVETRSCTTNPGTLTSRVTLRIRQGRRGRKTSMNVKNNGSFARNVIVSRTPGHSESARGMAGSAAMYLCTMYYIHKRNNS